MRSLDAKSRERFERIWHLVEDGMAFRAARTVVDAAMYGIGCTEGTVREKIEREKQNGQ
jgi:hypothetical protein